MLRNVLFIIATLLTCLASSQAKSNELACKDADTLMLVLEHQGVSVSQSGAPMVGCTILPDDYEPVIIGSLGIVTVDCIESDCEVVIEQAEHNGLLYVIGRGWLSEGLDPDIAYDLVENEVLPIGLPCRVSACFVKDGPAIGKTMLAESD